MHHQLIDERCNFRRRCFFHQVKLTFGLIVPLVVTFVIYNDLSFF